MTQETQTLVEWAESITVEDVEAAVQGIAEIWLYVLFGTLTASVLVMAAALILIRYVRKQSAKDRGRP